jgi:hypothetical protein
MSEITIADVGPIHGLKIAVPEGGGVVVLRGRNGVGKTTALEAVGSLLGSKPTVGVRDGAASGEISAFGATLRLGRRSSRSGELEVDSLEGKLSPADLVDPGLKSDDSADLARIKALLQLVNAQPSVSDFYSLFGGDQEAFEAACPDDVSRETDAVLMAAKIKRACESTARSVEASADNEAGKCAALRRSAEGVDVGITTDAAVLQKSAEAAVEAHAQIKAQRDHARRALSSAAMARQQLEQAESATTVVDYAALIADAQQVVALAASAANEAADDADFCREAVRKAQAALDAAEARSKLAHQDLDNKMTRLEDLRKAARQSEAQRAETERSLDGWREAIEAAEAVVDPTDDEIEAAAIAVTQARKAIEDGALARKAIEDLEKAKAHQEKAKALTAKANQIRGAAKSTDDVLSSFVAKCGTQLQVKAGRLYMETNRGLTLFAELSHGERWKVAIDVALNAFPANSAHLPVLTIPQEAFEGLDAINRDIVAKHARDRGVVIITAECSIDEQITSEVL